MANTTNMVFSESTNKTGMAELFYDLTSSNSTSYTLYKVARDFNNSLLHYQNLALDANGGWQFDDWNQVSAPLKAINIVSGTNNYAILVDDETSANQIIEVERVECSVDATGSNYVVLAPYDEMAEEGSITQNATLSGIPSSYYIKDNRVYLFPKPNYATTSGLKVWVSRTTTYFAGTDTTKVAGIPHSHQEYLVYRAAYLYCVKNLPQIANGYLNMVQDLETKIKRFYSRRDKNEHRNINMANISYR